jgi:hypothetical protein
MQTYVLRHPYVQLLPAAQQRALADLQPLLARFSAAVSAPPEEAAYRACLQAMRQEIEGYAADQRGGWYTQVGWAGLGWAFLCRSLQASSPR